jgi:hypothetical protein
MSAERIETIRDADQTLQDISQQESSSDHHFLEH